MAKDKNDPEAIAAKKEKKEKKDKKRKRESEVGDAGDDVAVVSETKKDKKKKRKSSADGDAMAIDAPNGDAVAVKDEDDDEKEEKKVVVKTDIPIGALVPFANPLCDDKSQKKVLKSVKKAAKSKALKRGVKECVKAIRKSPPSNPQSLSLNSTTLPSGIVVLAADISPMDVISHIPVLCEDHGIPYVYVPSRAELGAAGSTKRPTSVVMLMPKAGKKAADDKEDKEGEKGWEESFAELNKLALKLGQGVKV